MKKFILALLISVAGINLSLAQQATYALYDVVAANGNGVRFWQGDSWKIHMGNLPEYHYGPVTDYSIKMNMDATSGRGWTWGTPGGTPVAAIGNQGNMQIAGTFTANSTIQSYGNLRTTAVGNGNGYYGDDGSGSTIFSITRQANNETRFQSYGYHTFYSGGNTGNERMRIDANGNVGIGTTSPQEALHINGNVRGNANGALRISSGSGTLEIGAQNSSYAHFYTDRPSFYFGNPVTLGSSLSSYNSNDMTLQTGGTTRMTISNSTGNVGIGTTSPAYKFHVSAADASIQQRFQRTGSGTGITDVGVDDQGFKFFVGGYDAPTLKVLFGSNGNVGIGTTSPVYGRLQVTQQSNAVDQGIALLSSAGQRSMRIWVDENNAYIYSGAGQANLILNNTGNVGIGTTNPGSYKLAVEGKIGAREVNVIATNPWPDYVFEKNYKLPSLEEIKNYIDQNQHLPEVPSAKEVEKSGVNLGEMNALLLKKIEELTLYTIEMNKKMEEMRSENQQLKSRVEKLEK